MPEDIKAAAAEVLDAATEFATELTEKPAAVEATPVAEVKDVPKGVVISQADYDALRTMSKEVAGLKSKAAIMDKMSDLFKGDSEDPKDVFVRRELHRLVPELADVARIKEVLPMIVEALGASAEERVEHRATDAVGIMQDLMGKAGLDGKDADACGYIEEALTREIRGNKELTALWAKGQVKSAVTKAFDKVQSKLLAPIRGNTKRNAVQMQTESPKAGPTSGGGVGAGKESAVKIDFTDTSREGTKKVHDAAYERLMELQDKD